MRLPQRTSDGAKGGDHARGKRAVHRRRTGRAQRRLTENGVANETGNRHTGGIRLRFHERGFLLAKARLECDLALSGFAAAAGHVRSPFPLFTPAARPSPCSWSSAELAGRRPGRERLGRWVSKGRADVSLWAKPVPKHRSWSRVRKPWPWDRRGAEAPRLVSKGHEGSLVVVQRRNADCGNTGAENRSLWCFPH